MIRVLAGLISHFLPDWRHDCRPDANHPHRRRYTRAYQRKCGMVKNCWIVSGVLGLACTSISLILVLSLSATLLSFVILDETS